MSQMSHLSEGWGSRIRNLNGTFRNTSVKSTFLGGTFSFEGRRERVWDPRKSKISLRNYLWKTPSYCTLPLNSIRLFVYNLELCLSSLAISMPLPWGWHGRRKSFESKSMLSISRTLVFVHTPQHVRAQTRERD